MHVGIERVGAYIPLTRLPFSVIAGGAPKGPEKAVAWCDEDSITMAVAAAMDCLMGITNKTAIELLIFATTTPPFAEKQSASIAAKALGLSPTVKTVDINGSLRCGTQALQHALDSVTAGSARKALVLTADCRMGTPKSGMEMQLGDGAAAFLIGTDHLLAELTGSASQANEMMDNWRRPGDDFVHSWEDRFINLHGYQETTQRAINTLCATTGLAVSDYQRVCCYAPDARNHAGLAKAINCSKTQLQDPLFGRVGNTGSAFAPMLFIAALEEAVAGDAILVANYGDGADALAFKVITPLETSQSPSTGIHRGVRYYLNRRRVVDSYDKYLNARGLTITEYPVPDDQGISATVQYRNRDENLSLQGQACTACGTHQFPKGRICVRCHSLDNWSPATYALSQGKVLTYTLDAFYPSPEPPTVATIIEVVMDDGSAGPRIHMQFTDAPSEAIRTGLKVAFALRVIHRAGKRPNYFWKCLPAVNSVGEIQ